MILSFLSGLSDLVYPPHCLICRTPLSTRQTQGPLCVHCDLSIPLNIPPFCLKCSRYLGETIQYPKCESCRHRPIHFDFAWSALRYEDPIKGLIHRFKFEQKTLLRHYFCQQMIDFINRYKLDINQFDLIIPVPLSSTRLRERGYNQAEFLAQGISKHYSIPLARNICQKIRHTRAQSLLSQKERWTNLQAAFRINHSKSINDRSILIIDDLLTTGATASQLAAVLKNAGAKTVGVFTLAITL